MKKWSFLAWVLVFGYAILYIPIFTIIAYSFNDSSLASHWDGVSLRWYRQMFEDRQIRESLFLSIRIALVSATFATVLGTCAGLALARLRKFRGRQLFSGMIAAPLVMPEVITGLSLLVLFIAMQELIGWPDGRGATTITIAHITFSMAFVAVIIQGRLAGQDESLEEAAQDLGARPLNVLLDITVPLLAPAMLAGWLLAFTLSFDDLVISSFVTGPGANTLPIYIYSQVKLGVQPDINALATIIIAVVALGVVLSMFLMRWQNKRAV
ncbi:MAG: putrescine transport system permease protein [Lysobacterales bacterium]|jgi:putrescine transport system permease protein